MTIGWCKRTLEELMYKTRATGITLYRALVKLRTIPLTPGLPSLAEILRNGLLVSEGSKGPWLTTKFCEWHWQNVSPHSRMVTTKRSMPDAWLGTIRGRQCSTYVWMGIKLNCRQLKLLDNTYKLAEITSVVKHYLPRTSKLLSRSSQPIQNKPVSINIAPASRYKTSFTPEVKTQYVPNLSEGWWVQNCIRNRLPGRGWNCPSPLLVMLISLVTRQNLHQEQTLWLRLMLSKFLPGTTTATLQNLQSFL